MLARTVNPQNCQWIGQSRLHRVALDALEYGRELIQQCLIAESDADIGNVCVVYVVAGNTFQQVVFT